MGKMRKRISFIESVIVSPVKNTFALNLVYFFSLKSKGRIKKIKRGRGRKKRNLHIFFLAANENYHLLHKLERGRSKRKRGKSEEKKNNDITDGLKPLEANLLVTLKLARQVRK